MKSVVVEEWMGRIGLRPPESIILALLREEGVFYGKVLYLAQWLGASSLRGAYNALDNLERKGLITRSVVDFGFLKRTAYQPNEELIQKIVEGEISEEQARNL